MAWDSISLTPRSYRCQKQGFPFPAFLFQKHVVCGSTRKHTEACQMDDVLREDIGRSYSIDSHWHKSADHQRRPLSSGSTGHQLTSTSASEKLPVSWQLGGWAADSGECDSSLQGRPTLGQGGDGQCLNQRCPAMLRLLTRRFAHKPSAWLRPVTVSHNWMVDLGSFVFIQIKLM